jgi:hypothetical protein
MRKNDDFRKLLEKARTAPEKKPGENAPVPGGGMKKKSQGSEKYRRLLEVNLMLPSLFFLLLPNKCNTRLRTLLISVSLLDKQKAKQKERDEDEGRYRDRASERQRQDKVGDAEDPEGGGVAALAAVDIEMSKYLGGDLAHTHLVKGLDYALLNKVRGESTSTQAANKVESKAADEEDRRRGALKTTKVSQQAMTTIF